MIFIFRAGLMPLCLSDYPQLPLTGRLQSNTSPLTQTLQHEEEKGKSPNKATIGGIVIVVEGVRK